MPMTYERPTAIEIFCVWVLSAAVAGAQPAPGAMSAELQAHLKNERLMIVTSIRGLPLGVRDGLQKLFDSQSLDIAEPGGQFQSTGGNINPNLPTRRLIAAGCSYDHCLVYYERGGITRTWRAALFHWAPEATRFEWGGAAPAGLKTFEDVRSAALSGAIRNPSSLKQISPDW